VSRTTILALALAVAAAGGAVYLRSVSPTPSKPTTTAEVPRSSTEVDSPSSIPPIRVLLGGDPRPTWTLRIDGPYRITSDDGEAILAEGSRFETATVEASVQAIRVGRHDLAAESVTIAPARDGDLWLGDRRYRGQLRLSRLANSQLAAINILPLEDYLASVLPSEMPGDFSRAAQQAQVIAARTYALYQMKNAPAGRQFDVFDSVQSQAYGGMQFVGQGGAIFAVESAASRQIVESTRGVALVYHDRLFCTYYSAVCGGGTLDGRTMFADAAPPLVRVPCEYCRAGPHFRWSLELSRDQVEADLAEHFRRLGKELGELTAIVVEPTRLAGPPSFRVVGSIDSAVVSAADVRRYLLQDQTVYSSRFDLSLGLDALAVDGRGWGHGVGLCQWGARGQADAGRTCEEILAYYYPGGRLVVIR
jgi:stage II sporulation protein D